MITKEDLVNGALCILKDRVRAVKNSENPDSENPTNENVAAALLVLLDESHLFIMKNHKIKKWPNGMRVWLALNR